MKSIRNRLNWIDWAKYVAIFLVVFGHMGSPFNAYIFAFHMPLFFTISGFLQKRRSLGKELGNSLKCLLVPYVIYNLYLLVYSYFTGEYNADYPLSMLLGLQWNLSMACRPLWFLWALFFSRLLFTALPQKTANLMALPLMGLCFALNGTEYMHPESNYFQLWTVAECYPFFVLGHLMKAHNLHTILNRVPGLVNLLLCIGLFALGTWVSTQNGGVNIFRCHPGDNALLFYLSAALMSVSLLMVIYRYLDVPSSHVQTVSEGTLLIFAVHQSILWPLHSFMSHGLVSFLVAVGIIALFSCLIPVCHKIAPVLIGKWK